MSDNVVSVNFHKIKELASEQGLTISGLEKQTRLYHNMIQRWKKPNSDPKMNALYAVASHFGVKVDDLIIEVDVEDRNRE